MNGIQDMDTDDWVQMEEEVHSPVKKKAQL